jgi:NarL family two-component system sensor histidine kinase LiaS
MLEVKLLKRPDGIRLSIRDNGVGFNLDAKKHTSYGIVSMKERVNEIGGFLNIITAPDRGTRIEIRVSIFVEGDESDG